MHNRNPRLHDCHVRLRRHLASDNGHAASPSVRRPPVTSTTPNHRDANQSRRQAPVADEVEQLA